MNNKNEVLLSFEDISYMLCVGVDSYSGERFIDYPDSENYTVVDGAFILNLSEVPQKVELLLKTVQDVESYPQTDISLVELTDKGNNKISVERAQRISGYRYPEDLFDNDQFAIAVADKAIEANFRVFASNDLDYFEVLISMK